MWWAACLLAFAATLATAGQVWNKDSGKWSQADVQRILTASPWAERVQAKFHDPEDDEVPAVPLPTPAQAGMGGRGNVTDGKWDGGIPKNARNIPGVPDLAVLVRWESALPVRQAQLRMADTAALSGASAQRNYVISVTGLVPAGAYDAEGKLAQRKMTSESGDDTGATNSRNPEQMLEGLMADSMLATSSGIAIRPENVSLDAHTGELHFFFPRTHTIVRSDKEAIFETNFSSMKIKKRFRLKDMLYRGKLEL